MKRILFFLGTTALLFSLPHPLNADSIVISPNHFLPYNEGVTYVRNQTGLSVTSQSINGFFYAPVLLPDGARITSVVAFYRDNSPTGDIRITLYKRNLYNLDVTAMADWESSDNTLTEPLIHKITPIVGGNLVNNSGYIYLVRVIFDDVSAGSDCMLLGIKLFYN